MVQLPFLGLDTRTHKSCLREKQYHILDVVKDIHILLASDLQCVSIYLRLYLCFPLDYEFSHLVNIHQYQIQSDVEPDAQCFNNIIPSIFNFNSYPQATDIRDKL
jgi:hypothetical protein